MEARDRNLPLLGPGQGLRFDRRIHRQFCGHATRIGTSSRLRLQATLSRRGIRDPWISTSKSKRVCISGSRSPPGLNCYVYTIDTTANRLEMVDAKEAFQSTNGKDGKPLEYPKPGGKEVSVKNKIPWTSMSSGTSAVATSTRGQLRGPSLRGPRPHPPLAPKAGENPQTGPRLDPLTGASNKRPASQSPKGSSPEKNNKHSVRVHRAFTG
ncbi:hypothetical protein GGTG_13143 [Gaeumannomyces tritici R3-111a-1]|uniref:Uncharacterized protein n=1 Tax=Gaeumannomyces tritici (strain R3-111a-1) TaxID=644352 RepID=J3PI12_GAET3|nr:hypothetical protein GGTG_13143 [Gaeumannomyces tritici R3-111a-1]EJT69524.1 hypothetical protein GGTG_13143 [Gaeumannomyces tritici R3-111a-1]